MTTILDDHRRPHCKFKMTRSHIFWPSKQDVQYVALYKICTCPRRDRHSRAFPVEDVLSACSSHRPSCPPAPCWGGSRSWPALFELLLLLLVDQVLRTGGVVNDHRLTLKLRPLTKFFSFPLLPPTRNARLDYWLFPPAALRCETHLLLAAPPTHPTSLPQHHCIVLAFGTWHWHHSLLNSIGIANLACPVFTFCNAALVQFFYQTNWYLKLTVYVTFCGQLDYIKMFLPIHLMWFIVKRDLWKKESKAIKTICWWNTITHPIHKFKTTKKEEDSQ